MAHINEKCSEGSLVVLFKMLATIDSPKKKFFKSNDLKRPKMLNICRS